MVIKASAMHTHGFGRLAAGACVVAGIRLRDTLSGRGQPSIDSNNFALEVVMFVVLLERK